MDQRIWYIFHGRFLSEKAASLWAAKTAEAFMHSGASVTILAPRRKGDIAGGHSVRTIYLPTIDLFSVPLLGHGAFWISALVFALAATIYLLRHGRKGDVIFSNEPQAMFLVSLFFPRCFYELHVFPTHKRLLFRILLRRMRGIIAITKWIGNELTNVFGISPSRILHAPGGVDVKKFSIGISTKEARERLGLPLDRFIAMYTGHLYPWKGVDTLAQAAMLLPQGTEVIFVGGTHHDVEAFKKKYTSVMTLRIIGHQPHEVIPLWQKAADVLVLPTSGKAPIGRYYTSPMKLLEYMASERPIIASDLPSTREVVSDTSAFLVTPDDPESLAKAIQALCADKERGQRLAGEARERVKSFSWKKRGEQIHQFIESIARS